MERPDRRVVGVRWSPAAVLIATALGLGASATAATLADCLPTGYVFQGRRSQLTLGLQPPVPVFPADPDNVFCKPPQSGELLIANPDGFALVAYLVGTGVQFATASSSSGTGPRSTPANLSARLVFEFQLVPHDPESTAPVEIFVTGRHAFGGVRTGVTGVGRALNQHAGTYLVHAFQYTGVPVIPRWHTTGLVPQTGESFDVSQAMEVPVRVPLFLEVTIDQSSSATGGIGVHEGSGSAEISSTVTVQVDTHAPARIVFALEDRLGLPAPRLGVVHAPEPDADLLYWAAAAALGARRAGGRPATRSRG